MSSNLCVLQRFIQFFLRLYVWKRSTAQHSQRSSRILLALVTLLSLARKVHRGIPKPQALSFSSLAQMIQTVADDLYCITYFTPFQHARVGRMRKSSELLADTLALFLASHSVWQGSEDICVVQNEIDFLRYELQCTDEYDAENFIMSDIKQLRQRRRDIKWQMARAVCEWLFAGPDLFLERISVSLTINPVYDVLQIRRGEEGVRAWTGFLAAFINLRFITHK